MPTATVSGFLDINNLGAPFDDLALKVWSGMILEAFTKNIVTDGRHTKRTITSGKSAQFPVVGSVGTVFHTRGTHISFQQVGSNERVISIQDLMLAPIFIDFLDDAKSHFDIQRAYATQQGQALAEATDLRVLMAMISASNQNANITGANGTPGGLQVTNAAIRTDAAVLKAGVYDAAEIFDENNIPQMGRSFFCAPQQFYLLLQDGEFLDRDFGGDGSRATAVMRNAADFEVVKTNNLPPNTSFVGNTDYPTSLQRDYTNTVAVASHASSAGQVELVGVGFESEWDPDRQGWMLIAKQAKGFDYLRPEAAVEFQTA